jgi:hypothetical protein
VTFAQALCSGLFPAQIHRLSCCRKKVNQKIPFLCFPGGVTGVNLLLFSRNSLMLFAFRLATTHTTLYRTSVVKYIDHSDCDCELIDFSTTSYLI